MKILIIDFYHNTGNVGGLRWERFCKYLPGHGIEPIVICSGKSNSDNIHHVFFLSSSTSHGQCHDSSLWGRLLLWMRGNLLIPDPRRLWPVYRLAEKLIRLHKITVVITTGPPHSVHLAGLRLKKNLGVNWIADFRDPFFSYWFKHFYITRFARRRYYRHYWNIIGTADRVLYVEPGMKNATVVSNGFDPDDFAGEVDPGLEVVYVGSLSDKKLLPDISFRHVQGVSHEQAIYEMRRAGYLLVAYPDDVIPSKIYEYMASGRPILSYGIRGKGAELIERCGAGIHIDEHSKETVRDEEEIERYNVKNITKQLAEIIWNVTGV